MKYGKVIELFAAETGCPLRTALDLFYKSLTYIEMSEGISDMHCRSEKYLADELRLELQEQKQLTK